MRQKEFLIRNQKKLQTSKKEIPPIVSAKPLLPLQFLLGLLDKAVGGAGACVGAWWYFCDFLFAALVAVSQKKRVMCVLSDFTKGAAVATKKWFHRITNGLCWKRP